MIGVDGESSNNKNGSIPEDPTSPLKALISSAGLKKTSRHSSDRQQVPHLGHPMLIATVFGTIDAAKRLDSPLTWA